MEDDNIVISNSLYMALLDVNSRHNILIDYIFNNTELSRYRDNELDDVVVESRLLKVIEPIEYSKTRCKLIHEALKNKVNQEKE
jgi:hypothetical protein